VRRALIRRFQLALSQAEAARECGGNCANNMWRQCLHKSVAVRMRRTASLILPRCHGARPAPLLSEGLRVCRVTCARKTSRWRIARECAPSACSADRRCRSGFRRASPDATIETIRELPALLRNF